MVRVLGAEPARDRFGDPLPEEAVARLGGLRLRHYSSVLVGDFSPDSKIFAASDGGQEIVCWDTTSGRQVRRLPVALRGWPDFLRYSSDGKRLILVGEKRNFYVIDAVTGAERVKLVQDMAQQPYNDARAVDLSQDGTTAVTVYAGKILIVWDLIEGKRLSYFKIQTDFERFAYRPLALTPDGKRLVLPHADGSLYLADARTGKELLTFEMSPDSTRNGPPRVAISPNGRYLAYGGKSNSTGNDPCRRVTLCDVRTGKCLHEFSSKKPIGQWVFTLDSRSLATREGDAIHIYDISSGKGTCSFLSPSGSHELIFSRDGRKLASFWGTCILLYDVVAERLVHAPVGHPWFLRQIHFFPDGKRLVSHTSMRGEIIVWDLDTSQPVATYPSGELQHWIVVADNGEEIYFLPWNQRVTLGQTNEMRTDAKTKANGKSRRFTEPDNLQIYCWRWKTDRVEQQIAAKTSKAYEAFVRSPNGRHGHSYDGITYSADGRCVALCDQQLCIREVASGQNRIQFARMAGLNPLALSPDGRFLAGYGGAGSTWIYSTVTGKRVAEYPANLSNVTAVAFSPDSRLLATGRYDGTILLWKVPESDELPARLSKDETLNYWKELSGDAVCANRALAGLAAAPAQAVPLIKERFRTDWKHPDDKQLARLIADLDDDAFQAREQATRELSEAGVDAANVLRQALTKSPSPEAKRRIEGILNRLSKSAIPKYLRELRAIEVLERIGSPQAKDLLRSLADKSLPPELHEEVQASLRRMGDKP
jgi:WD40 repeat protein